MQSFFDFSFTVFLYYFEIINNFQLFFTFFFFTFHLNNSFYNEFSFSGNYVFFSIIFFISPTSFYIIIYCCLLVVLHLVELLGCYGCEQSKSKTHSVCIWENCKNKNNNSRGSLTYTLQK